MKTWHLFVQYVTCSGELNFVQYGMRLLAANVPHLVATYAHALDFLNDWYQSVTYDRDQHTTDTETGLQRR